MIIKNKLSIIAKPVTGKHLERQTHLDYSNDTDTTEQEHAQSCAIHRIFLSKVQNILRKQKLPSSALMTPEQDLAL